MEKFERTWDYKPKPLVYIAGPLSGDAPVYIKNMKKMITMGEEVRKLGASIMVPGNDFLSGLENGDMTILDFLQNSMDQMVRCDAVIFCEGWEDSRGCLNEIDEAMTMGIPVFFKISDFKDWMDELKNVKCIYNLGSP